MPLHRQAAACLVMAAVLLVAPAVPALAQTSVTGPEGQTLTVSKTEGISPAGETVTVTGTGYDENKGIYVAYCVDNGPGVPPSPCGGGADTTGSLGASHWISSNPPSYAEGLTEPYLPGGAFSVTLNLTPTINEIDCTTVICAVVTRADHTRSADRSQDVRVPIRFAATGGGDHALADDGGTSDPAGDSTPNTSTGETSPAPGVVTAGPAPTAVPAPVADDLAVARVSTSDSGQRWWYAATGIAGALLLAALVTTWLGRRRRKRVAR